MTQAPYVPLAPDWVASLPRLMSPDNKYLWFRVAGAEARAEMAGWRKRWQAAQIAAQAFAESVGAVGYWPPLWHDEGRTATLFAFNEKPANEDKAWRILKASAKDTHYKAHAFKKTEAGMGLAARMAVLPGFPSETEIADALAAIHSISYFDVDGGGNTGSGVVGSGFNPAAALEWAGDALIVRVANPMATLRSKVEFSTYRLDEDAGTPRYQYSGTRHGFDAQGAPLAPTLDIPGWRAPDGYAPISEAERDLIFAQSRVDQERMDAA